MQKAEFGAPQESICCLPPKSTFSCCAVGSKKEENYLHESKCSLKPENKRVGKRHFYLLKYHCFELIPELMLCKFFQLHIICEKICPELDAFCEGSIGSAYFWNKGIQLTA